MVDDFGIKYRSKEDALYLLACLRKKYEIATDWKGERYIGIIFVWDYVNRWVDLSMPGYIEKALKRFCTPPYTCNQYSPHASLKPQYRASAQITEDPDISPLLDSNGKHCLQEIIGTILYHARVINNPLLPALGSIASEQSEGTEATAKAAAQVLDYCATYHNPTLRYRKSDMILRVHSDVSYLSVSKGRYRTAGYFFLSSAAQSQNSPTTKPSTIPDNKSPLEPLPPSNGAVHVLYTILKSIMTSATEAEIAAIFVNCQECIHLRNTLEDLGYPQPPTHIQVDNECAVGIVIDTVKQKRTKSMDMRFYWIRDRVKQGQFFIYWRRGTDNLAAYHTKHHPVSRHQSVRKNYLLNSVTLPTSLSRGKNGGINTLRRRESEPYVKNLKYYHTNYVNSLKYFFQC